MSKKVIHISSCSDCPHSYYSKRWESYICLRIHMPLRPSLCPDEGVMTICPLKDTPTTNAEALKAKVAELEDIQKTLYPDKCPITNAPFFMLIHHPELGWQPTYGGPYDSYTIPNKDEDGDFIRHRYDHDRGGWVDECENMYLSIVDSDEYACMEDEMKDLKADNARMRGALEFVRNFEGYNLDSESHKAIEQALKGEG